MAISNREETRVASASPEAGTLQAAPLEQPHGDGRPSGSVPTGSNLPYSFDPVEEARQTDSILRSPSPGGTNLAFSTLNKSFGAVGKRAIRKNAEGLIVAPDTETAADQIDSVSHRDQANSDTLTPKKAATQILQHEILEGLDALERPAVGLFVSGLSAGLDVGFSLFLMAAAVTRADGELPRAVEKLLVANLYSVGFIFVILGRSELFTEQTTLAVLPTLRGRSSIGRLLRLWGLVWTSNVLGATAFALLASFVGPSLGVIEPRAFGEIAHRMTDHRPGAIFLSGILAGWLMGLLSWLVAAGRDTISQIVLVWLVTTAIGFAGLHHVVLGSVEVLAGFFARQGISPADVARFLLWATLGNALGGTVFVAILKYGLARPGAQTESAGGYTVV